jgi:hypothetical protein
MAEIVTVAVNDTISKIVKSKRRVKPNEEHLWTKRVLALNPHIGHPDRIYPNDKLLLPESLNEPVSDEKKMAKRAVPCARPASLSPAHEL